MSDKKKPAIKTTRIPQGSVVGDDVRAKYYYIDASGASVYIHTRSRQKAIEYIREEYGFDKYSLRVG